VKSLTYIEKKQVKDLADKFHEKINDISKNAYEKLTDSYYKRRLEHADRDGGGQNNIQYSKETAEEILIIEIELKQSIAANAETYIKSLANTADILGIKHLYIEFDNHKNAFTIKGYNQNIKKMEKEFTELDKNSAGYEDQKIAYGEIKKIADLMNDKGNCACIEIDKAISAAYGNIKENSEISIKDIQNRTKKATQVSFFTAILGAAMIIIGPLTLGIAAASGIVVNGVGLMSISAAASKIIPGKINSTGREEAIKDVQINETANKDIDKLVNIIKEGNRELISKKQTAYSLTLG
jgi:hypothetical protein